MMRYVLVLLLVLMAPSLMAADFLDDYLQVRKQIVRSLGYDSAVTAQPLDSITMNQFIREGAIAVAPLVRAKKSQQSFVTTAKTSDYSLDSLTISILSVWWQNDDSIRVLEYRPISTWRLLDHKTTLGVEYPFTKPSYYDYTDDKIYLYPVPGVADDTIKMITIEKVNDISTTSGVLTAFPSAFRIPIFKYALWRTAAAVRHPMRNEFYQDYRASMADLNAALNLRGQSATTDTQ